MKKILITGASGLLGSNIVKSAASQFEVYGIYNKNRVCVEGAKLFSLDLTEDGSCERIKEIEPEVIIHCAALTDLDYCQDHKDEAYAHNVLASINIADAAKEAGAYLMHISTDGVFDGKKGDYAEEDVPNPITVYGQTKLASEKEILTRCPDSCVLRTSIYGWNKMEKLSLAEWMLNKLEEKKELPGFKDVYFSPIIVNDLSDIIFKLFETRPIGIIHVAAGDSCTKLDFAYHIADIFGLDKNLIRPVSLDDIDLKVPRAKNLSLNTSKARGLLGSPLPTVTEGISRMKMLREDGYLEALRNG